MDIVTTRHFLEACSRDDEFTPPEQQMFALAAATIESLQADVERVRGLVLVASMAEGNWQKYNKLPEGEYDETIYQAEKMASAIRELRQALAAKGETR